MTNLDELEALARAATQGEWETRSLSSRFRRVHEIIGVFGKSEVFANVDGIAVPDRMNGRSFKEDANNMRFMAAANPATVLSLIAEVRRLREASEWQPIETAPKDGEFIVYGSYLYPDDKDITEYMAVGRSTGKLEYPIETHDGEALLGVFTHWRPLPATPALGDTDV